MSSSAVSAEQLPSSALNGAQQKEQNQLNQGVASNVPLWVDLHWSNHCSRSRCIWALRL
jgi:hypothetical protein